MATSEQILTDKEIEEITGFKSPSKQCKRLKDAGVFFIVRKDGRPRTTWQHFNNPGINTEKNKSDVLPNFGAI